MEPPNNNNSIQERLYKELEDPVDLDLFVKPRILVPCGHIAEKSNVDRVNKLCHTCRAPYTQLVKSPTIKNLVQIVQAMPKEEAVKEVEKADHTEEAEMLFANVKGLVRNKKLEDAIQLLGQVLDISPNYKEAIGYNACLWDMMEQKPVEQKPVEQKPTGKEEVNLFRRSIADFLNSKDRNCSRDVHTIATKAYNRLEDLDELDEQQKKSFEDFKNNFKQYNDQSRFIYFSNLLAYLYS